MFRTIITVRPSSDGSGCILGGVLRWYDYSTKQEIDLISALPQGALEKTMERLRDYWKDLWEFSSDCEVEMHDVGDLIFVGCPISHGLIQRFIKNVNSLRPHARVELANQGGAK